MSNWRDNPNLIECYENCVAMFRGEKITPWAQPFKQNIITRPDQSIEIMERRLALRLSQRELAAHAGMNQSFISRAENGSSRSVWPVIISTLDRLEQQ